MHNTISGVSVGVMRINMSKYVSPWQPGLAAGAAGRRSGHTQCWGELAAIISILSCLTSTSPTLGINTSRLSVRCYYLNGFQALYSGILHLLTDVNHGQNFIRNRRQFCYFPQFLGQKWSFVELFCKPPFINNCCRYATDINPSPKLDLGSGHLGCRLVVLCVSVAVKLWSAPLP